MQDLIKPRWVEIQPNEWIKNNYIIYSEKAGLLTDGLIWLCVSYQGIINELRLFHY